MSGFHPWLESHMDACSNTCMSKEVLDRANAGLGHHELEQRNLPALSMLYAIEPRGYLPQPNLEPIWSVRSVQRSVVRRVRSIDRTLLTAPSSLSPFSQERGAFHAKGRVPIFRAKASAAFRGQRNLEGRLGPSAGIDRRSSDDSFDQIGSYDGLAPGPSHV